jgi:hypothetical protein
VNFSAIPDENRAKVADHGHLAISVLRRECARTPSTMQWYGEGRASFRTPWDQHPITLGGYRPKAESSRSMA